METVGRTGRVLWSIVLLVAWALLMAQHGYALGNADVTVIGESPKVGPHAQAMRENLAADLECELGRVSVKATTTEKLGFTGRGEGIAAQACVLLIQR